ncbi:MAG TPA: S8 family serine peptidase, partial [Vicinamibacterales bacterium]|nr:S8 family serine peptidase [Vicinamibacterales bacterium]
MRANGVRHRTVEWICAAAGVGLGLAVCTGQSSTLATHQKRMSFHNRLLLNRAVVEHLHRIEVMLLARDADLAAARALVESLGGHVQRSYPDVGYMRVEVPTEQLSTLVDSDSIAAYQISSMSKATWYRDGAPEGNAEMHRGFEVLPPDGAPAPVPHGDLPVLSAASSRQSGYTAEDDAGVGEWITQHPTFDGRGVTIALLESGEPAFLDSIVGTAKALDGRSLPKLAGILNTIDPDEPDETRVSLDTVVKTETTWARVGARTYIVPAPGAYRLGVFELPAGSNLVHRFGVLENETTNAILVDTNGDASFQDETPVADVNDRFDARTLRLTHPQRDISFVMARGRRAHTVHLYLAIGSHQTMTLSVAAGSRSKDGLAYGVSPNARVLLVRTRDIQYRLNDLIEGYLETAARSDVDIFCDSSGIEIVPDTADDFSGLVFRRFTEKYRKPVIHSAGNLQLLMNSVNALGEGFSVGGAIGSATFAALFGGGEIGGLFVSPIGSAGPAIDGSIKPDFLAPMHRIAADLPGAAASSGLPKNGPTDRLPVGYQLSGGTSASSPYAAGVVALLISGAKQQHVPYSLGALERALRIGARFLPDFPSYQQGNGVLDVNMAWHELTHDVAVPHIVTSATIVHPLAQYAAHGADGQGIFEFEGWTAGTTQTRNIRFRRESGPVEPTSYRVSWTGNDGTFATAPSVTLPLNETVGASVTIHPRSPGADSALLNLHDPATDAIVHRVQATIVASESFDSATRSLRIAGALPLMRVNTHYFQVPDDVGMMSLELHVERGIVRPRILPSHSLVPYYYQ